jgi:hypothetical protein
LARENVKQDKIIHTTPKALSILFPPMRRADGNKRTRTPTNNKKGRGDSRRTQNRQAGGREIDTLVRRHEEMPVDLLNSGPVEHERRAEVSLQTIIPLGQNWMPSRGRSFLSVCITFAPLRGQFSSLFSRTQIQFAGVRTFTLYLIRMRQLVLEECGLGRQRALEL